MEKKLKRTDQQNKALWAYFTELAEELNASGQDMRKVLKPEVEIPWTKESIHKFLWKPVQKIMFDIDSTTQLDVKQVSEVYETLNRHTVKRGVSVPFPSNEDQLI